MSILEAFYKVNDASSQYDKSFVFFYSGQRVKDKNMTIGKLHPSTLAETKAGKEEILWWRWEYDASNVENIRTYLQMITSENELIKMYITKENTNTFNRLKRLIELNNDLVHFFLTYVNKLYWLKETPTEKTGLTLEQCQALVLPATQHLSKVVSQVMENEQPHKLVASLLRTEFEKESMDYKLETGHLKDVVKTSEKQKKVGKKLKN